MRQAHALIFAFCHIVLSAFPYRLTSNICQLIFISTVQVARTFRRFGSLLWQQLVEQSVMLFAFGFLLKLLLPSKRNPMTFLLQLRWIFQRFVANLMVQHIVPVLDTILKDSSPVRIRKSCCRKRGLILDFCLNLQILVRRFRVFNHNWIRYVSLLQATYVP